MTDEPVTTLGRSLRAEYQAWLVQFVPSWPDECRLAVRDWETLSQVDAEFARLLRHIQECLELDAWLGSGFFPPPPAGNAVFDPTAAGDSPGVPPVQAEATQAAASRPAPPSRAEVFTPLRAEPWPSPGTADRDAAPHRTIPFPADSANTVAIPGSDSPLLRATTGSSSGFSSGGLRDLARLLQATPHIDTAAENDHERLTEPLPFRSNPDRTEPAGLAESAWPALPDTALQADAQFRVPRLASAITELPEAGSGESAMQAFSIQESGGITQPAGAESTIIRASEDADGLTTTDLRRLGRELSIDDADLPTIDTASLPPAAASAPVRDWRNLLSMLPLRREIFMAPPATPGSAGVPAGYADLRREVFVAPPATPGSAGVPAGMTVGDDDIHEAMPEVVQRNVATAVTAAPNSMAAAPPDLHDLLEALSQEIRREYQRFYGSG